MGFVVGGAFLFLSLSFFLSMSVWDNLTIFMGQLLDPTLSIHIHIYAKKADGILKRK